VATALPRCGSIYEAADTSRQDLIAARRQHRGTASLEFDIFEIVWGDQSPFDVDKQSKIVATIQASAHTMALAVP